MLLINLLLAGSALALQPDAKWSDFDDPLRELEFGSLNFLHTTDTHGWYLGHLNQRQYSSDWGDFVSFSDRLKQRAYTQGQDLLLVDSGDRHDGNGLSDMTKLHGELSDPIFMSADYDIVSLGNHELYEESVSTWEFDNMIPYYGERFISTNVQYLNDDNQWVVFGNATHRYFTTDVNGYHVLALSVMFDFHPTHPRARVIPIQDMVKSDWFNDLLTQYKQMPVDIVLVVSHLPVTRNWQESTFLHGYLRAYFPNTPIQYFGGHSHIRDFAVYDELSTALQSGRYCETVGFLSLDNLTEISTFSSKAVHRRYIDFNLHSFMHHTNATKLPEFHTKKGLAVSRRIEKLADQLGLGDSWGTVPHNFYMSTANYYANDKKSLLRFLERDVLVRLQPKMCTLPSSYNATGNNRAILVNTGSIRYDLYKGAFTRNALFTVSPFHNKWKVIPNIPVKVAARLKGILNAGDVIASMGRPAAKLLSPHQEAINRRVEEKPVMEVEDQSSDQSVIRAAAVSKRRLSYGYTTRDELGAHGDDTIHKVLQEFRVPNVIESFEKGNNSDLTDVVFYDFIESHVLWALELSCHNTTLYNELASTSVYYSDCAKEFNVGHLLKGYVEENWPLEGI